MPSREQRVRVWRGELKKTTGGLTKDDLVKNKKGKIVSRRKSRQAGDQNNLGEWLRNKGDRFEDTPQARAEKGLPHTQSTKPKPAKKAPEPKPERVPPSSLKHRKQDDEDWAASLGPPKPKKKTAVKPRALMPRPPRPLPKPKVLKAKGSAPKKRIVLHAREPQPEFVKFKDMGKSSLKKAAEPEQLYPVRKGIVVESGPIARNQNPKFAELSVSNIRRRSSRRKKRVDYSKFY